jgi:hypothetical protein
MMEVENYNWELLLGFQIVKQVSVDSSYDMTEVKIEWSAKFEMLLYLIFFGFWLIGIWNTCI